MRYIGMPLGMWLLYRKSFRDNLICVLDLNAEEADRTTKKAKYEYKRIIAKLPEFEKGDRFKMNLVNCAVFISLVLFMEPKPTVEKLTEYYSKSMMTKPMKLFCRIGGKNKFSEKDIKDMKNTADFKAADRNPYSWNMDFLPYPDDSGYEARFTRFGL